MTGNVVIVHNGIVENFQELRKELSDEGVVFNSETDTEVIVQLVERYISAGFGLVESAKKSLQQLKGAHGIVLMSSLEPDKIVAARIGNAGGVVIGIGEHEMFIASDLPAILEHTRKVVFLESRQMAIVSAERLTIQTLGGKTVSYLEQIVALGPTSREKGETKP